MLQHMQITDRELQDIYKKAPQKYQIPEKRKIQEIYTRSHEKILEVARALRKGVPFDSLARKYSERRVGEGQVPGTLNFLTMEELGQIGPAVFRMKVGEISDPVQIYNGFVMVRLLAVQPARQAKFEEVADRIKSEIQNERHLQQWRALLAQLRAHAKIKINEPLLQQEAKSFDPKKTIPIFGVRKAYWK